MIKSFSNKHSRSAKGLYFLIDDELTTIAQVTERIFPEDDNGPGAMKLGVAHFIDQQLAGPWGENAKEYRFGPFSTENKETGQSKLTKRELFVNGIQKMNEVGKSKHGVPFHEATITQQIDLLQMFESDEVTIKGVGSAYFFDVLKKATLEGVYADPSYGGNRHMEGWKMKEHPGATAHYKDIIESDEFVPIKPVPLQAKHQSQGGK